MFVKEDMLASKWQCFCLVRTSHGPDLHCFSLCEPRTVRAQSVSYSTWCQPMQNQSVCDKVLIQERVFELGYSEVDGSNHSILDNANF